MSVRGESTVFFPLRRSSKRRGSQDDGSDGRKGETKHWNERGLAGFNSRQNHNPDAPDQTFTRRKNSNLHEVMERKTDEAQERRRRRRRRKRRKDSKDAREKKRKEGTKKQKKAGVIALFGNLMTLPDVAAPDWLNAADWSESVSEAPPLVPKSRTIGRWSGCYWAWARGG